MSRGADPAVEAKEIGGAVDVPYRIPGMHVEYHLADLPVPLGVWRSVAYSLKDGRIEQSNFHDYQVLRLSDEPRIEVDIVPSRDEPGGIGEPPVAGVAPAVANAVFAPTGVRLRALPLGPARASRLPSPGTCQQPASGACWRAREE
jgi:CO/xanthine dehydrogenase Mo-binding subunit